MAPRPVKIITVAISLTVIFATELLGWWIIKRLNMAPLAVIGLIRIFQITAIGRLVVKQEGDLGAIGWAPRLWMPGLKKGAIWSLAFGAVAAVAMVAIYFSGQNPLHLIRSPLPPHMEELILFFAVGGLIAPVAEELCFRGIVYSFFRRWGILIALVASTAIFVVLHTIHGLPVTQIVGGIVFAIAYETTGNLMVPITIHCLGNIAIFTLSLM
jgi:uncharacterized protein